MRTTDLGAKIIPIRRPERLIDAEAPFRKYRRAGLLNARFGVEGVEPLFWGYHAPSERWNGWDTPRFPREVAELIAEWVNRVEPGGAWWVGDVLHHVSSDGAHVEQSASDSLGLYQFDGWVWLEVRG